MRNYKRTGMVILGLIILCVGCLGVWVSVVKYNNPSYTSGKVIAARISGQKYSVVLQQDSLAFLDGTGQLLDEYRPITAGDRIVDSCLYDLDRDGTDEILLITGAKGEDFGKELLFLSPEATLPENSASQSIQVHTFWKKNIQDLNPWKIQTADVDGDANNEISIGVYKTARFHPVLAKRPFIYSWENGGLSPKWLGSRLSRPFDDYTFADLNGDGLDELISIEHAASGNKLIAAYKWKGFGFEETSESAEFPGLLEIRREQCGTKAGINLIVKFSRKNGELFWGRFRQKGDTIFLEKEISAKEAAALAD